MSLIGRAGSGRVGSVACDRSPFFGRGVVSGWHRIGLDLRPVGLGRRVAIADVRLPGLEVSHRSQTP